MVLNQKRLDTRKKGIFFAMRLVKLWNKLSKKSSKCSKVRLDWALSNLMCLGMSLLVQRDWTRDDLQSSLPTPSIICFYDSVILEMHG